MYGGGSGRPVHDGLKRFDDAEGVVFIGKAQEKAPVFRTEKRRSQAGRATRGSCARRRW
jgi:hypothetical protein